MKKYGPLSGRCALAGSCRFDKRRTKFQKLLAGTRTPNPQPSTLNPKPSLLSPPSLPAPSLSSLSCHHLLSTLTDSAKAWSVRLGIRHGLEEAEAQVALAVVAGLVAHLGEGVGGGIGRGESRTRAGRDGEGPRGLLDLCWVSRLCCNFSSCRRVKPLLWAQLGWSRPFLTPLNPKP